MVDVTEEAVDVIKTVREQHGFGEEAGVRLQPVSSQDGSTGIGVSFTEEPETGDEVAERAGLRVFVEGSLAEQLDDAVLDVKETSEGVELVLRN